MQKLFIAGTIFICLLMYCDSNLFARTISSKKDAVSQKLMEQDLEIQKLKQENEQYKTVIQSLQNKMVHRLPIADKIFVVISVVLIIAALLILTYIARNTIFKYNLKNEDIIIQQIMNNTFGLPAGTVRGILAISIFIILVITIVIYYPEDIPDSIKVTASLVFGFYFAKSSGQLKDYMDRMQNSDYQTVDKEKEALQTLNKVQTAGVNKSNHFIEQAEKCINDAHQAKSPGEADKLYDQAIQKAQMAQESTVHEAITKKKMDCKQRIKDISEKMKVLKEINVEETEIQKFNNELLEFFKKQEYNKALNVADKLSAMIDYALEGQIVKTLTTAKKNLDASQSLGADGKTIIKSIFSIITKFKQDNNDIFIDLLRKRITGSFIDESDLKKILGYIEKSGESSKIAKAINKSIHKFEQMLPMKLPDNLKDINIIKKILCVGKNELESLFVSPEFEEDIGPEDFYDFVKKIRNNIIDEAFSHIQLPAELPFSEYKKVIRSCQNDDDGRGALKSIMDVLDIGKDILTDKTLQKWELLV